MLPPRPISTAGTAHVVVCDVGDLVADLDAVEVLARLRLTARRRGCGLRLSRKALRPVIRPSECSMTCSVHGSKLPPGPLGRH